MPYRLRDQCAASGPRISAAKGTVPRSDPCFIGVSSVANCIGFVLLLRFVLVPYASNSHAYLSCGSPIRAFTRDPCDTPDSARLSKKSGKRSRIACSLRDMVQSRDALLLRCGVLFRACARSKVVLACGRLESWEARRSRGDRLNFSRDARQAMVAGIGDSDIVTAPLGR
jgi:hypothetical protein